MVVGAGRGPLVRASLNAARLTGRRIRVWAVEKNLNAVVHIGAMVASEGCVRQPPPCPVDVMHFSDVKWGVMHCDSAQGRTCVRLHYLHYLHACSSVASGHELSTRLGTRALCFKFT